MPDVSERKIIALLRERFPEVYEKNRHILFGLGLRSLIEAGRWNTYEKTKEEPDEYPLRP
jgi:hypothetical protein